MRQTTKKEAKTNKNLQHSSSSLRVLMYEGHGGPSSQGLMNTSIIVGVQGGGVLPKGAEQIQWGQAGELDSVHPPSTERLRQGGMKERTRRKRMGSEAEGG